MNLFDGQPGADQEIELKLIETSVEFLVVLEPCNQCGELDILGDGDRVCPKCESEQHDPPYNDTGI